MGGVEGSRPHWSLTRPDPTVVWTLRNGHAEALALPLCLLISGACTSGPLAPSCERRTGSLVDAVGTVAASATRSYEASVAGQFKPVSDPDLEQGTGELWPNLCSNRVMNAHVIQCPYCGEPLEVLVDWSIRTQEYVEDCQVCCKPITLSINIDDEHGTHIDARPESE